MELIEYVITLLEIVVVHEQLMIELFQIHQAIIDGDVIEQEVDQIVLHVKKQNLLMENVIILHDQCLVLNEIINHNQTRRYILNGDVHDYIDEVLLIVVL